MQCPWIPTATKHTVSGKAGEHQEEGSEQPGGTVSVSVLYTAILKIKKTKQNKPKNWGKRRSEKNDN